MPKKDILTLDWDAAMESQRQALIAQRDAMKDNKATFIAMMGSEEIFNGVMKELDKAIENYNKAPKLGEITLELATRKKRRKKDA